jgi:hypothetical protein
VGQSVKKANGFKRDFGVWRSLALQLPFCFEVRTLSDRLVSSAPE